MEMNVDLNRGIIEANPVRSELDRDRLAFLDRFFNERVEDKRLQGVSYLISKGGVVQARNAIGKRTCREGSDALTIHAIGEIHELTMAFTATAILQLVEQGMITLNQPAADILHELDDPYFRTITIFHLLTHTSGLIPNPNVFAEAYPFRI